MKGKTSWLVAAVRGGGPKQRFIRKSIVGWTRPAMPNELAYFIETETSLVTKLIVRDGDLVSGVDRR
jgi:hypothetical protein